MFEYRNVVETSDPKAAGLVEFMLNCDDIQYQKWWSGAHFAFHTIKRVANNVGSLIYFEELVGRYKLRNKAQIVAYEKGKVLEMQMIKGIKLPAVLSIHIENKQNAVCIEHVLRLGYKGFGRIADPVLKMLYSKSFETAFKEHVTEEIYKYCKASQKT